MVVDCQFVTGAIKVGRVHARSIDLNIHSTRNEARTSDPAPSFLPQLARLCTERDGSSRPTYSCYGPSHRGFRGPRFRLMSFTHIPQQKPMPLLTYDLPFLVVVRYGLAAR